MRAFTSVWSVVEQRARMEAGRADLIRAHAQSVREIRAIGDTKALQVRIPKRNLETGGVKRWGESSEANYATYMDFLLKWGGIKEKVGTREVITNELIDEIKGLTPTKSWPKREPTSLSSEVPATLELRLAFADPLSLPWRVFGHSAAIIAVATQKRDCGK